MCMSLECVCCHYVRNIYTVTFYITVLLLELFDYADAESGLVLPFYDIN